jgi:chromosome partitioning protein
MVIVLATQKGGSGKSTIAINLAMYLSSLSKTLILDADKQATISESDFSEKIDIMQKFGNLEKTIESCKKKHENIVIDVAGKDSTELRSALISADIAIVPFIASQSDLYTLETIDNIIKEAKEYNRKLKAYAVINNASTHSANKRAINAKEFIKANSKLKVLETVLHSRNAYLDTFYATKTVFDTKDKKAKNEVNNLIKELKI